MSDSQFAAFVAVTFLLAVTPGVSTAVVVSNVLQRGRVAGCLAASGVALANTTWAAASAVGLSALVLRAPVMLDVIRVTGGVFLGWLALRSLGRAFSRAHGDDVLSPPSSRAARAPFVEGLVANLLHPSVAVYYLSVLPSFLPTQQIHQPLFAILAAIHIATAFACHVAWGTGFHVLRPFWNRPVIHRVLHGGIGVALLALAGVVLAG